MTGLCRRCGGVIPDCPDCHGEGIPYYKTNRKPAVVRVRRGAGQEQLSQGRWQVPDASE